MATAPRSKSVGGAASIDDYILSVSAREPEILRELRAETAKDSASMMQVPVAEGQFLALLVELIGAKRVLEAGTYTGYSAIAMALALPKDGKLITMDISEKWTAIAKQFWQRAGLGDRIELRLAPAIETLNALIAAGQSGAFDLSFIDAGNKEMYVDYYEASLKLVRKGGLVVIDNTLSRGLVLPDADLSSLDERRRMHIQGVRKFNQHIHRDERVTLSMLSISDGVTIARKR
jgi:predicted O-methyltransferase YrrM